VADESEGHYRTKRVRPARAVLPGRDAVPVGPVGAPTTPSVPISSATRC